MIRCSHAIDAEGATTRMMGKGIEMNLADAEALAKRVMNSQSLLDQGWRFRFDDARRRFGCCRYATKEITISRHLTALNSEREVLQTITHEVAHALCGKAEGHGLTWSRTHRALGGDGRRCYTPEWAGGQVRQPSRTVVLTADMLLLGR